MSDRNSKIERIEELLADRALFGLDAVENKELTSLLSDSAIDDESFDRIAAEVTLSTLSQVTEPMPESLKQKIRDAFPRRVTDESSESSTLTTQKIRTSEDEPDNRLYTKPKFKRREMVAWLAAAASTLALVGDRLGVFSTFGHPLSPKESREALLKGQSDNVLAVCQSTQDSHARFAEGDVVWNTNAQIGFLRVRGLPTNEPFIHQYQLWIFDAKQDDRYPIDGGTFDIESAKVDSIVPIRPKLHVVQPTMFAVTIEKRGGVVVATRERLLLVAQVVLKPV